MKLSSLVSSVVGMAIGVVLTIYIVGCNNEIRFRHDPITQEVTVVPRVGDVLMWNVPVTWRSGGSGPCESALFTSTGGKTCRIVAAADDIVYTYKCPKGQYCDPDVAVDDDYKPVILPSGGPSSPVAPSATPAAALDEDPTEPWIYLECVSGAVSFDPLDKNDRKIGEIVHWRSTGPNHLAPGWKVILDPGSYAVCGGTTTEFGAADSCVLAGTAGTTYTYKVQANGCASSTGKLTPK